MAKARKRKQAVGRFPSTATERRRRARAFVRRDFGGSTAVKRFDARKPEDHLERMFFETLQVYVESE